MRFEAFAGMTPAEKVGTLLLCMSVYQTPFLLAWTEGASKGAMFGLYDVLAMAWSYICCQVSS